MLYIIVVTDATTLTQINRWNWNQTQRAGFHCLPVYHHLTKVELGCYYLRDPGLSNAATAVQKADLRETRISTAAIESFWTVVRSCPLCELHPIAVGEALTSFEMPMCCSCFAAQPATAPLFSSSPPIAGITVQKIYSCLRDMFVNMHNS